MPESHGKGNVGLLLPRTQRKGSHVEERDVALEGKASGVPQMCETRWLSLIKPSPRPLVTSLSIIRVLSYQTPSARCQLEGREGISRQNFLSGSALENFTGDSCLREINKGTKRKRCRVIHMTSYS